MKTLYRLRHTLTEHHFFRQILRQRNYRYYIRYYEKRFTKLKNHIFKKMCRATISFLRCVSRTILLVNYVWPEQKNWIIKYLLSCHVLGIKFSITCHSTGVLCSCPGLQTQIHWSCTALPRSVLQNCNTWWWENDSTKACFDLYHACFSWFVVFITLSLMPLLLIFQYLYCRYSWASIIQTPKGLTWVSISWRWLYDRGRDYYEFWFHWD